MPVIELTYHPDSQTIFNCLKDLPYSCWLDSGKPASHYGRYDIMSALPVKRIITLGKTTRVYETSCTGEKLEYEGNEDPLERLKIELSTLDNQDKVINDSSLPFSGGAIGYFGYDLSHHYINIPQKTPPLSNALPDMHIGIYHWAIIQDHQEQKAYISYLPLCSDETIDAIQKRLKKTSTTDFSEPFSEPIVVQQLESAISRDQYLERLKSIDHYIRSGDCYQVNFAHYFQGTYSGNPYSAYSQLRSAMASPFSAFLSIGNQAIMSLSPERFLKVDGNKVLTQPIKGTTPRHISPRADKDSAEKLLLSEKNRAENLMIVDLLRNDLGKHCLPGSIDVDVLFGLQSFPNVHHLVSTIKGVLRPSASSIDLLRDCFPGGSITGAPKKRAMEIINELEQQSRGIYCGSIAYINVNGDMDSNIAIRTVSCDGKKLYCWGGGGIVADSDPEEEYQESLAKINSILAILGQPSIP